MSEKLDIYICVSILHFAILFIYLFASDLC